MLIHPTPQKTEQVFCLNTTVIPLYVEVLCVYLPFSHIEYLKDVQLLVGV